MLTCPLCKKTMRVLTPTCAGCQSDLTLLVDYVQLMDGGLAKAQELTRAGELGAAVWAYLEVLEVDPTNPKARRQVGQVVTAVRQFDQGMAKYRRPGSGWASGVMWWALGVLLGGVLGYLVGSVQLLPPIPTETANQTAPEGE